MEPSEFEQLIKNKIAQGSDIHAEQISQSKPFVWTRVQQNLSSRNRSIRYLLVAAVFLFICSSSFMQHQFLQKQHQEVKILSQRIEELHHSNASQTKILSKKALELSSLREELNQLEVSLATQEKPEYKAAKVLYKTDTVFINKTQIITETPNEIIEESPVIESIPAKLVLNKKESNLIYPSYAASNKKAPKDESLKLKLNAFVSN